MLHDTMHAIAPVIWGGVFIAALYFRHQRRLAEIRAGIPQGFRRERGRYAETTGHAAEIEALNSAHAREVADLRERVRVLERIATDEARNTPARQLAAQIEALKD